MTQDKRPIKTHTQKPERKKKLSSILRCIQTWQVEELYFMINYYLKKFTNL